MRAGGVSTLALMPGGAAAATVPCPKPETIESLVDGIGDLKSQVAANKVRMAPIVAELAAKEQKLLDRYKDLAAGDIATAEGNRYLVKIGAQSDEQSVIAGGLKRVFDWVGVDKFIGRAKITFEALKGLLTEEQYAEIVSRARTGRRNITAVVKAEPLRAA